MGPIRQRNRSRSTADFLHRNDVFEITQTCAAGSLLHGDAEQAQIAEFRPQLARKRVVAIDLRSNGSDVRLREGRDAGAQQFDVLAQVEVEVFRELRLHESAPCTDARISRKNSR
jgi:hypothetical protein